jgi:hypothetical protein
LPQFDEVHPFFMRDPQVALGQPFAEHLVFGLKELNLTDQLISAATGQEKEQGLEKPFHGGILQQDIASGEMSLLFCTPPLPAV